MVLKYLTFNTITYRWFNQCYLIIKKKIEILLYFNTITSSIKDYFRYNFRILKHANKKIIYTRMQIKFYLKKKLLIQYCKK